jgi:hypothetical protein
MHGADDAPVRSQGRVCVFTATGSLINSCPARARRGSSPPRARIDVVLATACDVAILPSC